MIHLDPARAAVVAVDMHRGHLDPAVATLPLAAERCGPVIKRAAALFADLRARGVPIVHVVTEYRDAAEIAANPFWKAADDDPSKARRGILRHNLAGSPGTSPASTPRRACCAPPSRRPTATSGWWSRPMPSTRWTGTTCTGSR